MMKGKTALAGGAAAIMAAGAWQLFPGFGSVDGISTPSSAEFISGRSVFGDFVSGSRPQAGRLRAIGFVADQVRGVSDAVLVSEQAGECAGRGIYWLRENSASKLAITAPHRGSDRHTGTLAALLFAETKARAAAWNSAPRHPTAHCQYAVDLAREKNHLFSAFSLGFADAVPDGILVQLHGFEGSLRDTQIAQEAAVILSNGTDRPSQKVLDVADCLSLAFAPRKVLVYPGDTGELGALSNVQGQLLRANSFDGFVHIEIAADLRAMLMSDGEMRAKFAVCLRQAAQ